MAIHRAGTELVNWYLLEEGGKVTIVDAGLPTYRRQLEGALHEIGRALEDVEAIVLTHAHIDHVGFSQLLQDERGTPVYAHVDELVQAQTGKPPKTEGSWVSAALRHRTARKVIFHIARNGGARPPRVATVTAFGDGEALDVPGHPNHRPFMRSCAERRPVASPPVLCTSSMPSWPTRTVDGMRFETMSNRSRELTPMRAPFRPARPSSRRSSSRRG